MSNYAQLVKAGYSAIKAVDPAIKVIVHISNGFDNNLFPVEFGWFKKTMELILISLVSRSIPRPQIGRLLNSQCLTNMNDMVTRYNKEVMVVEVGMSWDQATACNSFLADLIAKVKSVTNGKGLGVFYWEPESYNNWQGYTLGAFDNSGKPTVALDAFK
jgi:arabinogalactan endo-1,4-beta-galactosidase